MEPPWSSLELEARRELLGLARMTIEQHLAGLAMARHTPRHDALARPSGAFVSLHRHDELRGCMGSILPRDPLYEAVRRCAVAAAFEDPRFAPVGKGELGALVIEISVLSPLRRVTADQVEVGRHGLLISRSGLRGVLLPQVAVDQAWDRDTFLAQTCRKAGLPAQAWRDPATVIEVFNAEVFSERDV